MVIASLLVKGTTYRQFTRLGGASQESLEGWTRLEQLPWMISHTPGHRNEKWSVSSSPLVAASLCHWMLIMEVYDSRGYSTLATVSNSLQWPFIVLFGRNLLAGKHRMELLDLDWLVRKNGCQDPTMQSFIQEERKGKKNYTIIHIFLLLFRRKEREKRTMPSSTRSLLFQLIFIFYNSILQFSFGRHLISKPVYVGIWYDTNLIPDTIVIWVANRYFPITNTSGPYQWKPCHLG